ncbi:MAG TPA: polysaccharide deacetylase family protein [Burkholderiales bacterium]|nr:polysaccharide deacetylase family protein [Burkholderiales bacterium]
MLLHAAASVVLAAHPQAWPWVLGVLVANHLVLLYATLSPRDRLLGPNLVRLPAAAARRREISLTFDDGPDPEVTPRVLELLDRYQAKASFFCIGEKAAARPELVKEIARRGHSVENHSYHHHRAFAFFGISRLKREVDAAQATVASITGRPPVFFRAPAGFRSPLLDPVLAPRGLRYVSWTRRGFDAVSADPRRILRRLTRGLAAGDVLLMHDSAPVVLAVLPALLEQLSARGLKAVSLVSACANEPGE